MVRKIWLKILGGILLVSSLGFAAYADVDSPLRLTLSLDKGIYRAGDKMIFELTFKNISQEDQYFYINQDYNALLFQIVNEKKITQAYDLTRIHAKVWKRGDFKLVKAQEEFEWIVEGTLTVSGTAPRIEFDDSFIPLSDMGEYSVFIEYTATAGHGQEFGLKNVFMDTLKSNVRKFKVIDQQKGLK